MSRINGYAPQDVATLGVSNTSAETGKVGGKATVSQPVLNGTGDATRLSTASAAVVQAAAGSDVRTEKVAALQAAIANGTYNVSASDVADKLIGSLLGER